MTFLNATLVFGVAAITLPIVLHLLARREPRKVVFPSTRFLSKRFESNRNRLRIRKWWLLALRIAALTALAIALARPTIHRSLSLTWLTIGLLAIIAVALLVMASVALATSKSKTTGYGLAASALAAMIGVGLWSLLTVISGPSMLVDQEQPVAIAIVLDNSPTSAWSTTGDDRIARMKDLATWMVTRLPPTSRIAIIDRSAQVASFSLDAGSAVARIEQLQPLQVTQPIDSRLEVAARLVRSSDLTQRRVLLISDLAAGSWEPALSQVSLSQTFPGEPEVALTVFDLGEYSAVNRSLTVPRFADNSPPRGTPVPVATTVRVSGGDSDAPVSITAELEVFQNDPALPVVRDGLVKLPEAISVDRTSIKVASGSSQEILLTIPSLDVGVHHGRVRLIGTDAMPLDDVRYFSIQVMPPSRVLLVGDQEEEARIIADAISASAGVADETQTAFTVERIGYEDLAVVRLDDFNALVLLDPGRDAIGDPAVTAYAASGGGVLVALGPAIGEESFESSLLPELVRRWRSPDPGTFFQVLNSSHRVTEPLSANTPWSDFRVRQYWQVEPGENDNVLIQYAGTEHAAVVERTFRPAENRAPGRLLLLTTPIPALAGPTRRWNELYGTDPWPAWLLTRKSVEYLSGRGTAERMAPVGQPRLVQVQSGQQAEAETPGRVQLFRPRAAQSIPLNVPPDARQIAINKVSRAGTYWIRGLTIDDGFSANLTDDALDFDRIDQAALDTLFGPQQYGLATSREEIEFAESKAAERVSLHSPAMLLALVIFLLEQVLGNRFYRKPAKTIAVQTA